VSWWKVLPVPEFYAAVAALPKAPGVRQVLRKLVEQAATRPDEARVLTRTNARCVRSPGTAEHPPIRLYYSVDATTIYLLHVEEYDELDDSDEEE
jgi:hypothetical protein